MVYKKIIKFLKKIFKRRKKNKFRRKKSSKKNTLSRRKKTKKSKSFKKVFKKKKVKARRVAPRKKNKKTKKKIELQLAGEVTYYFPKVNAAVIKLKKSLCIGMPIRIKGKKTDFCQTVGSLQLNRNPVEKGARGQEIGLEVFRQVMPGDYVYVNSSV